VSPGLEFFGSVSPANEGSGDEDSDGHESETARLFRTNNLGCCRRCEDMTGTPEGLRALVEDSYKHFNWYDIQKTAALGCELCGLIWDVTEHEDWDYDLDDKKEEDNEDNRIITRDEIRIVADFKTQPAAIGADEMSHVLSGMQLRRIRVIIPYDGKMCGWSRKDHLLQREGEVINLVTYDG
jgi:hypothetical protein